MYPDDEYPEAEYTNFDDLRYQWKQFLNEELQSFKIIRSDLYGTGCVCDLQTIIETGDTSPEMIMKLVPRVSDCASECIYGKYVEYINAFLSRFTNMQGAPMTVVDLGDEEQFFYNTFEAVAKNKAIFNTWDLWRTTGVVNTK
jgi:hypothetical protein